MDLIDQTPIIATQFLPESPDLTPLPPTPKKSRLVPIITAIIVAILLGATSIFSYKYFSLKSQLVSTPTLTPSPTALADPTTDWKTYTNEYYGFSFKYPEADFVMCPNYNYEKSLALFAEGFNCPEQTYVLPIISFVDYYEEYLSAKPTTQRNIMNNGIQGTIKHYEFTSADGEMNGIIADIAIIATKLGEIQLTVYGDNSNFLERQKIYNQILSTFRFIDNNQIINTSGWMTFSNEIYSLKYPNDWDTYFINGDTNGTLMIAPKEKVDNVREMSGGFGGGIFLTMTININETPPNWKTDENWIVSEENVNINGVNGTKYTVNVIQDLPGSTRGDRIISVVIKHDKSYIQIDLLDKNQITTLDQILSTFKFNNN